MNKLPNIIGSTREDLLLLIANVPIHCECEDYDFCPWCGRLQEDASGNRWADDNTHHKPECPVLQARTLIGAVECQRCFGWHPVSGPCERAEG